MDLPLILGLVIGVMCLLVVVGVFFLVRGGGVAQPQSMRHQAAVSDSLRALVHSQRHQQEEGAGKTRDGTQLAIAAAAESVETRKKRSTSARLTIEKKIRYAKWKITPIQFRGLQAVTTLAIFIPAYLKFAPIVWITALIFAPVVWTTLLNMAISKRFKAFDGDYPVLLLSYVSLLKTGMGAIGGLESAAKGLDQGSLVRSEVELLVERLRLGLTEEQAINAFGEDIAHPELELFVQSLILSRRVGGTLSATLERLARQVRKRQQFREQAVAAVGMERGSIYAIAVIMTLLMLYLTFAQPELVLPAFSDPVGKIIVQTGFCLIFIGFFWSRKVTNIKV